LRGHAGWGGGANEHQADESGHRALPRSVEIGRRIMLETEAPACNSSTRSPTRATAGFGWWPPHFTSDLLGAGWGWARPSDRELRNQLTDNLALTPDIQLPGNPARLPDETYLWVFGFRTRVSF
jgi:hypothetical protein